MPEHHGATGFHINPNYWLVQRRTGEDVRDRFDGGTGARKVGRILGRGGFAATFALDAAKGTVAVGAARAMGFGHWWLIGAALAVTAGQVWPVQLGVRGGGGLSTARGAARWSASRPWPIGRCWVGCSAGCGAGRGGSRQCRAAPGGLAPASAGGGGGR